MFIGLIQNKLDWIYNKMLFFYKGIAYPKSLKLYGRIRLACKKGGGKLIIGEQIVIRSSWYSNPAGGGMEKCLFHIQEGGELVIGNRSGISNTCISVKQSVKIGTDVLIGVNCVIYDNDFHSLAFKDRLKLPDNTVRSAPVVIGDGAWIGGHCIILKGVMIGKRSMVAAGSVVTKSIPDDELWGGNPARFLKYINEK